MDVKPYQPHPIRGSAGFSDRWITRVVVGWSAGSNRLDRHSSGIISDTLELICQLWAERCRNVGVVMSQHAFLRVGCNGKEKESNHRTSVVLNMLVTSWMLLFLIIIWFSNFIL